MDFEVKFVDTIKLFCATIFKKSNTELDWIVENKGGTA
jgi:hypothetical protein